MGWERKNRAASSSPWCRFVPCSLHGGKAGELVDAHPLGVPAEVDQLHRIAAEPGRDQVVQCQCGALHRHPPTLSGHRERGVHQQSDGGLGAGLGLLDFDVFDVQAQPGPRVLTGCCGSGERVGDGPWDVPGLDVAELPRS